jgi:hypothetical protein
MQDQAILLAVTYSRGAYKATFEISEEAFQEFKGNVGKIYDQTNVPIQNDGTPVPALELAHQKKRAAPKIGPLSLWIIERCKEQIFMEFMQQWADRDTTITSEDECAEAVKTWLGIGSRRDCDLPRYADETRRLIKLYAEWLSEQSE